MRVLLLFVSLASAAAMSACGSDGGGLPKGVLFSNLTDADVSVSHVDSSGHEDLLVQTVRPHQTGEFRIVLKDTAQGPCTDGTYIARNSSGGEVARHPAGFCDPWVVAAAPIPFTIRNLTASAVVISYRDGTAIEVGRAESGASLSGTLDALGNLADLCLGGTLAATPSHTSAQRQPISNCGDWTWTITSTPAGSP